jgi:hypothetical protein
MFSPLVLLILTTLVGKTQADVELVLDPTLSEVQWSTFVQPASDLYSKITSQIFWSTNPTQQVASVHENGLIGAILFAHGNHFTLELAPDDFIMVMATAVSRFVNGKNNDQDRFRERLGVRHNTGKQSIQAEVRFGEGDNMDSIIPQFVDQIPPVLNFLTPEFTTTQFSDIITANILTLSSYRAFYTYSSSIMCGVRSIKLKGTFADWVLLEQKYEKLKELFPEMDEWFNDFDSIMESIVETVYFMEVYQGERYEWGLNRQKKFWKGIAAYDANLIICGGPLHSYDGWMVFLDPYDEDGNYAAQRRRGKFTNGLGFVEYENNSTGVVQKGKLYAGFLGQNINNETRTVSPVRAAFGSYSTEASTHQMQIYDTSYDGEMVRITHKYNTLGTSFMVETLVSRVFHRNLEKQAWDVVTQDPHGEKIPIITDYNADKFKEPENECDDCQVDFVEYATTEKGTPCDSC